MEVSAGTTSTYSPAIVVTESIDSDHVTKHRSPRMARLAVVSRTLSFRKHRQTSDSDTQTAESNTGSRTTDTCAVTSSNRGAGCSDVIADATATDDAILTGGTGRRQNDSTDVTAFGDLTLSESTSGRDDDKCHVRFRFDSIVRADVDKDDVISSSCRLPKEPHPMRNQTVRRQYSTQEDLNHSNRSSPQLSVPSPSVLQTRSIETETAVRRRRWLFGRDPGVHRARKPSSALRKEIKAARQLGVIMGAFTICFLPYFICFTVVALCAECISVQLMTAVTWIGYLNSTLNPFLYPLCNANFRRKFRRMLGCVWSPLRMRQHDAIEAGNERTSHVSARLHSRRALSRAARTQ